MTVSQHDKGLRARALHEGQGAFIVAKGTFGFVKSGMSSAELRSFLKRR